MANPVVHFEIGCKDSPTTQKFYSDLFDWSIEVQGPAAMVATGSETGIQGHISSLGHEPHQYTMFYVEVANVQESLDRAQELGGKMITPVTDIPEMGHFAWFSDPEGNMIGLWKSA